MFVTRLISGIILVALALLFICTGGDVLLAVMLVLSLVGMFELYRIFKVEKRLPGIFGYIGCIAYYLNLKFHYSEDVMVIMLALLIALLGVFVFAYPKYHAHQIMASFFGLFYVGVMLSFLYQTRMLPQGQFIVWLIFLCSWGSDTAAYCVGVLFGKHKMSPILSPKKSVEGAVGGVVGAIVFGVVGAVVDAIVGGVVGALVFGVVGVTVFGVVGVTVFGVVGDTVGISFLYE